MGTKSRIGYQFSTSIAGVFQTFNCKENRLNEGSYYEASGEDASKAAEIAHAAFLIYKETKPEVRAQFLNKIADRLKESEAKLIAQYVKESSLSMGRGQNELDRTIFQLRTFAEIALKEKWRKPIISSDLPNGLDIRSCNEAIGPVVVFGASNFPFAYSTIGGDAASALAIGCPVIVKAHPMHAGTSELVAEIICDVAKELNLPDGVFSHLLSNTHHVGELLVTHPSVKAVGFTGSVAGGRALMDLAAQRKNPIPVFAEMGSVNPVVFFEEELSANRDSWVEKYAASISADAGQFCTKPGLLFVPNTASGIDFKNELEISLSNIESRPHLHPSIHASFSNKQGEFFVSRLDASAHSSKPILQTINSAQFQSDTGFREEFFGPQSIVVFYNNKEQLINDLDLLVGQLTATIVGTTGEISGATDVLEVLKRKAGRIIVNGVPTGVTVCDAMVHGGMYPASSDSRFSAVGSQSVYRFARPICYQNVPKELLPNCLQSTL